MKAVCSSRTALARWLAAICVACAAVVPVSAGATERMLVIVDPGIPDGEATAMGIAAKRGYEAQLGSPGLLADAGCTDFDTACYLAAARSVSASWVLAVELSADSGRTTVVARRIETATGTTTDSLSGALPDEGTVAALVELISAVAGSAPGEPEVKDPALEPPAARGAGGGAAVLAVSLGLIGAGAALGAVAAIAGWRLGVTKDTFETAPNETLDELMELDRLAKSGRRWATVTNVTLIVGGVALAGGLTVLLVDRLGHSGSSGKKMKKPGTLAVTPTGFRVRF